MSTYKNIAVAGGLTPQSPASASLGGFFSRALLKAGANLTILGRESAMNSPAATEFTSLGAKVVAVDYDDPSTLEKALQGIDVVVSALSMGGSDLQLTLAKAAKAAGVRLFVPSEYGNDTTNLSSDNPMYSKTLLQQQLRDLEMPYLLLFNGFFMDWIVPVALEVKDNEIIIVGEGKANISFTTREDVASFLSHILLNLPPAKLSNSIFPIQAHSGSLLSLAPLLLAKHPDAKVVHRSHDWALKKFADEGDFVAWLKVMWDEGEGGVGDEPLANDLFKEWNPRKIEEFF